ncbi:MAG: FAD-dependent oxidoreductase [Candidatus Hodarchaeota archaeon]
MANSCLIIGGEIAALRAAKDLVTLGIPVTLINPSKRLGRTTNMFQRGISDYAFNKDIISPYLESLESNANLILRNNAALTKVVKNQPPFEVEIEHNGTTETITAGAVILASGFEPFNAKILGEYGYGYLEGVITVFDLERAFQQDNCPITEKMERVIFILCTGSRSLRAGTNPDCSTYCCSYSINQALYIKKKFPGVETCLLYMDIRTIAKHEFLYNEARKSGVRFIRGRASAVDRSNNKLIAAFEDTLAEKHDMLLADLVVLAVGGMPFPGSDKIATSLGVQLTPNKFVKIIEKPVQTSTQGVFACGSACDGVKNIQQSLSEGGAAAMAVTQFLKG